MIRLDSISKQHGGRIPLMDASCALEKGEKVGLVGPNGSGNSTLFRMIMKDEQPDSGQVTVERGTTIGYFSQDVGEMNGMIVVAATLDGAGPVAVAGSKMRELEKRLETSEPDSDMERLVEAFGEAQARFEELG